MAVPSDKERLTRLETRAREAESALRQLKSYVQLLKTRTGNPQAAAQEAECTRVSIENQQLTTQVDSLKKKLVALEIRNGVVQIPTLKDQALLPPSSASKTQSPPSSSSFSSSTTPPLSSTESVAPEKKAKVQKEKKNGGEGGGGGGGEVGAGKPKEERKKKAGGGGGGGAQTAPVDVSRLDFRIGKILSAELHPDAETLYVEQVDVGEDKPRTVCSGLVRSIPIVELNNRDVIMLCNLKPAKMRGVVSEAMVMCASTPEKVEVLDPPDGCVPGERIVFEGYSGTPDTQLNPKKKIFEQVQPDFLVSEEGVATYRGIPFTVEGKGVCQAATMRGCGIK